MRRITIKRTAGEYRHIEDVLKKIGRQDIKKYIRAELRKILREFEDCPECITVANGKRTEKVIYVDNDIYSMLVSLSTIVKKPVNSIVDDLIIVPLLLPGKV